MGKGAGADKSGEKLLAEVRFAALDKMWGGSVQGGFKSQHRFIDHTGESARIGPGGLSLESTLDLDHPRVG